VGSYVFDLPGRLSRRRRRIDQAVFRAAKLFEEAIPVGHRGFLDAYLWPHDDLVDSPDDQARIIQLLPEAAKEWVGLSEVSDFWAEGEDDPGLPVVRLTAPIDLRQFDYRTLFRLVAQHDLGVTPALGARV